MTKQDLRALIDSLVSAGEDAEELEYWYEIFDDLPEEQQKELASQLEEERNALTEIDQDATENH